MINHARTLLLNRTSDYFAGLAGSEYIPPEFRPVTESTALQQVRHVLLPGTVDKTTELYIVDVIMRILHAPDLERGVFGFDPRITYDLNDNTLAKLADTRITVVTARSAACDVVPHYKLADLAIQFSVGSAGYYAWRVERVDDITVAVIPNRGTSHTQVALDRGDKQTQRVSLMTNYLSAYFGTPSGYLTGSFVTTYSTVLPPVYNIGDRLTELEQLDVASVLFPKTAAPGSVLSDLRLIWLNTMECTLRFGSAVLAYLHQLDALRTR